MATLKCHLTLKLTRCTCLVSHWAGSQATDFKIDGISLAQSGEDAGYKEALDLDASGNPAYLNFTHVERSLEVSASYQDGNWSLAAQAVQTNLIDARFSR